MIHAATESYPSQMTNHPSTFDINVIDVKPTLSRLHQDTNAHRSRVYSDVRAPARICSNMHARDFRENGVQSMPELVTG